MSIETIHLTIAIFFTLGVDAFVIFKFLKMNLKKAVAISFLINTASMIAAFMAQQYLVTKLPSNWFWLHHILHNYVTVFLIFSLVTLAVKILVETLIITFFEKEVSTQVIWFAIIIMNLITAFPGAVYDFVSRKPKISAPFILKESADWLKNTNDTIWFLDAKSGMLTKAEPGADKFYPLTDATPFFGYRICADGNAAITLGRTNAITISVFSSNKLEKSFTYPSEVETVDFADALPEKNIYATCLSNKVTVFDLRTGAPTNEIANIIFNELAKAINFSNSTSWICSIQKYVTLTNNFKSPLAEITVIMNNGIEIKTGNENFNFNVGTSARFIGIGFLADGENFLFQLGGEIMVLNVKTKEIGHLYEGILAIIKSKRYEF